MKTLRALLGWIIIAICFLWTAAIGAPVRLQFDQGDAGLEVVHLRERTPHGESVFLAAFPLIQPLVGPASPVISITADLPVGETRVQVCVRSAHGWSELSDVLLVVVQPTWSLEGDILTTSDGSRIRIWPELSDDLVRWRPVPFPDARFARVAAADASLTTNP